MGNKGKNKNLSVKEYLDRIKPYLSDMINNYKTEVEWRIHSGNTTIKKTQSKLQKLKI